MFLAGIFSMAAITTAAGLQRVSGLGRALCTPFVAAFRFLARLADASPTMRQLQRLNQMSDEELAAPGLTRDEALRRIIGLSGTL